MIWTPSHSTYHSSAVCTSFENWHLVAVAAPRAVLDGGASKNNFLWAVLASVRGWHPTGVSRWSRETEAAWASEIADAKVSALVQ